MNWSVANGMPSWGNPAVGRAEHRSCAAVVHDGVDVREELYLGQVALDEHPIGDGTQRGRVAVGADGHHDVDRQAGEPVEHRTERAHRPLAGVHHRANVTYTRGRRRGASNSGGSAAST